MTTFELLQQVADLQLICTYLALLLIGLGVVIALLPVARCDMCPHCRAEGANKHTPRCPMCFKRHASTERCE